MLTHPVNQFERWFTDASINGIPDVNAFSLATTSKCGKPAVRTVLLKLFDLKGFVFYTNYQSRKGLHIAENSNVAMLFPWLRINRQVSIEGSVQKLPVSESISYFISRPRGSQIGAWCSPQSEVIESRKFLEQKFEEAKLKFKNGKMPLPHNWGGYRIIPNRIEFWQGRENRLHDRFVYTCHGNEDWSMDRLAP